MIRAVTAIAAAALLSACVNVLPEKEVPDGLYRFGPMDVSHAIDASIIVREPEASRLVAGRAIAVEDATGALRLVRGVEWTDSATQMMQTALLDSLGGAGRNVAVASGAGAPADFELTWRISDFTLKAGEARCRLEATLLSGRSRDVVQQKTVSTTAIALNTSNAARAQALTDAGRACVGEVAAFIAETAVAAK